MSQDIRFLLNFLQLCRKFEPRVKLLNLFSQLFVALISFSLHFGLRMSSVSLSTTLLKNKKRSNSMIVLILPWWYQFRQNVMVAKKEILCQIMHKYPPKIQCPLLPPSLSPHFLHFTCLSWSQGITRLYEKADSFREYLK